MPSIVGKQEIPLKKLSLPISLGRNRIPRQRLLHRLYERNRSFRVHINQYLLRHIEARFSNVGTRNKFSVLFIDFAYQIHRHVQN